MTHHRAVDNPLPVEPEIPAPGEGTPEPELEDPDGPIMGTAQLKVTLRGEVADRPTLEELGDVVQAALMLQLGITSRVRGEWT